MRPRLLSLTVVCAAVLLLSQPVNAAHFCITFSSPEGAAGFAVMVFSGKITRVERIETRTSPLGEYLVTFKVENWWKGTPAREVRVLWRSNFMDCPIGVGSVGEDYLVYADPSMNVSGEQLPEVTYLNRTSRMPANREPETFLFGDWGREPRIDPKPALNRGDASEDLKVLRVLRQCTCFSTTFLQDASQSSSQKKEDVSACEFCLRRRFKYYR